MASQPPPAWSLRNFLDRFDSWVALEEPPVELRRHVLTWIFTRAEDPLSDAKREPGFEDLWFTRLPGSEHGDGAVVVCSYWVDPSTSTVSRNGFASLSLPLA